MNSINKDYFMKYLKNELTDDETRQLVAWLRENKENQEFLFSLKDSYLYLNYEKDKKEADTKHEWKLFSERVGLSKKTVSSGKHFSLKYIWTVLSVVGRQG